MSVITRIKSSKVGSLVLQSTIVHGHPYDGHTFQEAIDQYTQDMRVKPTRIYVGSRGYDPSLKLNVFKSEQKRFAPQIKKELKCRSVIEDIINHLKNDGRLGRNYLKGRLGDKINAIFAAIGYNFRLLPQWCKDLLFFIFYMLFTRVFCSPIITLFNTYFNTYLKLNF